MSIHHSLLAGSALQILKIRVIIHKEVLRLTRTSEHTPSGRIKPFRAVSGGVNVYADEDYKYI